MSHARISLMETDPARIDLLAALRNGGEPIDRLVPILYAELRGIAHRQLSRRRNSGTLATTALVHEAYLKLVDQTEAKWQDRLHFLALAAVAMRHILADRAKAQIADKRGGVRQRITFDDERIAASEQPEALLQINEALDRLSGINARLAKIVELRFFGGLTHEEIAQVMDLTVRTVERDWVKARMLLRQTLLA
jgi:RNA polymerase sigma factor (TIGR02999 family)